MIIDRVMPGGGFSEQFSSVYHPVATAWAVMALGAAGVHADIVDSARSRLADGQGADGRITLTSEHPDTIWPTALAILAWQGSIRHQEPMQRAVSFLVQSKGVTSEKKANSIYILDPSVAGWSWNQDTSSWVEPTALAILALDSAGQGNHGRVTDGVTLLMDRQLPGGGWNYGNTIVYDQELLPQPDNTGLALVALASKVEREEVQASLDYLQTRVKQLRSPRSLGWAVLGLDAWGIRPVKSQEWIRESLGLQNRYGVFDTSLLSLLKLADLAENGSIPFLSSGKNTHAE